MTTIHSSSSSRTSGGAVTEGSSAADAGRRRDRDDSNSDCTRTTTTTTSPLAFKEAKQQFMLAVEEGITALMEDRGYSRARAASALLHELRRDEVSSPSDNEVFHAMQSYGLGIDEATKALIVASVVKRAIKEQRCSVLEAVDDLTLKLLKTNVETVRGDDLSDDGEDRPRSPDRRIDAVASLQERATATSASRKQTTSSASKKSKSANKNVKNKPKVPQQQPLTKNGTSPKPLANRKRSIDETSTTNSSNSSNQPEMKVILRERSDSMNDVVDAKVALKCKVEDDGTLPDATNNILNNTPSSTTTVLRSTTPSVGVSRAKRSAAARGGDDGSIPLQPALKRARVGDVE